MNPNPINPEAVKILGEIGGALLVVIGLLFVFLFALIGLLTRRLDKIGERIARTIAEMTAAHAEELRQAFGMIQVLLDQHMDSTRRAIRDARDRARDEPTPAEDDPA
jgi:hypothetical protein